MMNKNKLKQSTVARRAGILSIAAAFLFYALIFATISPLYAQTSQPGSEKYVFRYESADEKNLNDEFAQGLRDNKDASKPVLKKTSVVAQGGIWGEGTLLKYDEGATDNIKNGEGGYKEDLDEHGYVYSTVYNCVPGTGRVDKTDDQIDGKFWKITVNTFVKLDKGFADANDYPTLVRIDDTSEYGPKPTPEPGKTTPDRSIKKFESEGKSESLIPEAVAKIPNECKPQITPSSKPSQGVKTANYYKLSPAEKTKADGASTVAGSAAGAGGAGGSKTVDCDSAEGVPLSWIICPIIDAGAAFSDFAFNKIIRPLLEDVPVSTDNKDPSYIAWTSFRVIANVLLVAALLAVVYSQAKGGK